MTKTLFFIIFKNIIYVYLLGTNEEREKLIEIRIKYDSLFNGKNANSVEGWK